MYAIRKKNRGGLWQTIKTFPDDQEESALELKWELQFKAESYQDSVVYELIQVNQR